MYANIEESVIQVAEYIVEHGATVRAAAKEFGIGKPTVYQDMQTRLKQIDGSLARAVDDVLQKNKAERHIRGGMATFIEYKGEKTDITRMIYGKRMLAGE